MSTPPAAPRFAMAVRVGLCAAILGPPLSAAWHEATSFGALCDGQTDDTLAIQAAVDAAAVTGGHVRVPAGVCMLGDQITLNSISNVNIVGEGAGSSVLRKLPGGYVGSNRMLEFKDARDCGLRALTLDGNRGSATGGQPLGVRVTSSTGLDFSQLDFIDHLGRALHVRGTASSPTQRVSIHDSRFARVGGTVIDLDDHWRDVRIVRNVFEDAEGAAVFYHAAEALVPQERLFVIGNSFHQSGAPPIYISSGGLLNSVISGNVIEGSKLRLLSLGGSVISGNHLIDSRIVLERGRPEPLTISNNTIDSGGINAGIMIEGPAGQAPQRLTITGNRIKSDRWGLSMIAGSEISVVANTFGSSSETALENSVGVHIEAIEPMRSLLIANNQFEGLKTGIEIGPAAHSPFDIDTVLITSNVIRSSMSGATGIAVPEVPNDQGASTLNLQVQGNLEVLSP